MTDTEKTTEKVCGKCGMKNRGHLVTANMCLVCV